jgi:5-methylcytosine-specific restriction enzyme A
MLKELDMRQQLEYEPVPASGPLTLGTIYSRSELHSRFGGNRTAGIVPSAREHAILLFHTEEPAQQFYKDRFDPAGLYSYSGEGTVGDMRWTAANRAVRDHEELGCDLWFFRRVQ